MGKFFKKLRCDAASRIVGERLSNFQSSSLEELPSTTVSDQATISTAPVTRKADKLTKPKKKSRSRFLPSPRSSKKGVKGCSKQIIKEADTKEENKIQVEVDEPQEYVTSKDLVNSENTPLHSPIADTVKNGRAVKKVPSDQEREVQEEHTMPPAHLECVVSGQGLTHALQNKPASFFIHSTMVDIFYLQVGILDDEGQEIPVEYRCAREYVHEVSYLPKRPGLCNIKVTWKGQHVKGSPFLVTVGGS